MRRIVCKNVNNMRDLGGYLTRNGEETKFFRFIRSNLPNNLMDDEIALLKNNGIKTIIDLRSIKDLETNPNDLKDIFKYYNVDIYEGLDIESLDRPDQYMKVLGNKSAMSKLFNIIINADGGILYNCTVGKDRSGIVSMLLLLVAGVFEDDIITDYEVSYTYIKDIVSNMKCHNPYSKPEYMEETLYKFKEQYHSIEKYMEYLGIDIEGIDKIRDKFFD